MSGSILGTRQEGYSLLREVPAIRRARDYHLYDLKGKRYLDLYQNNGRAILGHRPRQLSHVIKNTLAKGLLAEYPSVLERQFLKALAGLLPGYKDFRLYLTMERAMAAVSALLQTDASEILSDPALEAASESDFSLWRPYLEVPEEKRKSQPKVILPILPVPSASVPVVIGVRDNVHSGLPPSDLVSPVLLAGLKRAVFDLMASPYRSNDTNFDGPIWKRRGVYLTARCDLAEYSRVFRAFLSAGFLISPCFPGPSIIPGEYTPGEIKALKVLGRS
ncbi:MAG: hypothetical protein AB1798_12495 [Spirochaetota bacterium]